MKFLAPVLLFLLFSAATVAKEDAQVQGHPEPANDKMAHAKNSLEAVKEFVGIFTADNFVKKIVQTSIKAVAQMASGALGFVGAIIGLIMGIIQGQTESAELQFMREQFKQVHSKLDSIVLQLDEVKRLIEWRTTRVMYSDFEIFIQATTSLMDDYIAAPAADRDVRKRKFVDAFKRKPLAAFKLYQAITSNSQVIADNIATAAVHYTKNHRKQVMEFLLAMQRLIMRGAQLEIAYERLEHGEAAANIAENDWKIRMENLVTQMKVVDDQLVKAWPEQFEKDVDDFILENRDLKNEGFSCAVVDFLKNKYHWRLWFAVAYNPVSGFDNHAVSECGGLHRFRTSHGTSRNLVIASSDPSTSRFTQAKGEAWLEAAQSAGHQTTHAGTWLDEINRRISGSCDDAAFRGAICWGCNVWFCSTGRISYRKIVSPWPPGNVNALLFG